MLAREYCDAAGIKLKPIILSHHMLYGLKAYIYTYGATEPNPYPTPDPCLNPNRDPKPELYPPPPTTNQAGQQKMSKSDADSAIFMEDSAEDVRRKLEQAHCPTREAEEGESKVPEEESMQLVTDRLKNPCLDYVQHVLFSVPTAPLHRPSTPPPSP